MKERRQDSEGIKFQWFALNLEYALNQGIDIDNRIIKLTEDIEDHHFDYFDSRMTILEKLNRKAITIKINSYGGDVYSAMAIVARLKEASQRGIKIHTKGYGKIMSASTAILAAGDKRSMSKLVDFMHHEASYSVEGKHSEIQHEVKMSQNLSEKWCHLMYELTGTSKAYWVKNGIGKDFYLSPDVCLDLNIIDEVF